MVFSSSHDVFRLFLSYLELNFLGHPDHVGSRLWPAASLSGRSSASPMEHTRRQEASIKFTRGVMLAACTNSIAHEPFLVRIVYAYQVYRYCRTSITNSSVVDVPKTDRTPNRQQADALRT